MKPDLMTVGEAAHFFGVGPDWVRRLIHMGRLPATRTRGGRLLITGEAAEAYIRRRAERLAEQVAREGERIRELGGES